MIKTCFACRQEKSATEFYPNNQKADGLSTYCKPCFRAKQSLYAPRKLDASEAHPEGVKHCSRCNSDRPLTMFGKNRSTKDGLQHACKACSVEAVTASRHKDPTSHRRSSKNWREKNVDKHADNNARWKYGVEHGTYSRMLTEQNFRCKICNTDVPGGNANRFHIDHCHDTGKVRGLLCTNCNTGLGQFQHNKTFLLSAVSYLDLAESG